jgi:hypothetical protein
MGIAVPDDTETRTYSRFSSATWTAIALVFFFGVGLAGGGAYKIYFDDAESPQVATQVTPPPRQQIVHPQNFASNQAPSTSDLDKAAPDLARIEPTAPPGLAMPPAPAIPKKPGLPVPAIVQAAPPPAPEPVPQAEMTPALPYAETTPPPPLDTKPETQVAKQPHVAVPPKKPEKPTSVAKTRRTTTPQTVALHPPPSAPGNVAGPYRVQFGAFANEDNARRVQWAIEATGLKVDVSQERGPSGNALFFLRSPNYSNYATALSAAQTVQHRVQGFVNAIPIDYAILGDRSVAVQQQAER